MTCWNSIVEVDFSAHERSDATMSQDTVVRFRKKDEVVDPLTEFLREGTQQLISQEVSVELKMFLERHAGRFDEARRRAVVRKGYLPEREVLTGIGPVKVELPKVRDRSGAGACFRSGLVPPYVRRARTVQAVLPWLYLKGGCPRATCRKRSPPCWVSRRANCRPR